MSMAIMIRTFIIAALLMLAGPALAQNDIETPSNPDVFADIAQGEIGPDAENQALAEGPVQQLAEWSEELDTLRQELSRDSLTLDALATLRDEVTSVRNDIQVLVDEVAPRLAEQRALLEGLAPADGELAETPEIQAQQERIAELERELQPAELLLGRANTLRDDVISRRAVEFTGRLFERSSSILTPQLWADGLGDMPRLTQRLVELTENSWNSVRARATPASFAGLGVLVLILLILAIPLRRFALRKAARAETVDPTSFDKTLGALRIVLVSTLIPAIGFLMLLFGLESVGGLSLRAKAVLNAVASNTILFFLISGIVRAFLAPGLPAWRLVPVGNGYAHG